MEERQKLKAPEAKRGPAPEPCGVPAGPAAPRKVPAGRAVHGRAFRCSTIPLLQGYLAHKKHPPP